MSFFLSYLGFVFAIYIICISWREVEGHGYMLDPPGRASMWREGWPTPPDYSDNQQFCGGYYVSKQKILLN